MRGEGLFAEQIAQKFQIAAARVGIRTKVRNFPLRISAGLGAGN